MHPYHHAQSSTRKWGGVPEDYETIHDWFDESKAHLADLRHRALRHHAEGIFLAERLFGTTLTNSDGRVVPVRQIGEQHVREDLGRIPTAADWLRAIRLEPWMLRASKPDGPGPGPAPTAREGDPGPPGPAPSSPKNQPRLALPANSSLPGN
jgi:hypothetical protein